MAETRITVTADVSQAVKGIKALIKLLRTANRELKTLEMYCGSTSSIQAVALSHGSR